MSGEDVPYRLALLLVGRSPSRHLVGLARLERAAVVESQLRDPPAGRFTGSAGVDKTSDTDHVAALLIIGIGIEQIVADIFEDILDLAAGHARHVGLGVGNRGFAQHVFHRYLLARQYARAPAEARRQRHLGIELAAQRVANYLVHAAAKIAATIKQAIGGRDLPGVGCRIWLADFFDQRLH